MIIDISNHEPYLIQLYVILIAKTMENVLDLTFVNVPQDMVEQPVKKVIIQIKNWIIKQIFKDSFSVYILIYIH